MTSYKKILEQGKLARLGLLSDDAIAAATELLGRIEESNLETIRFVFVDQHGVLRGKTLVASAVASVCVDGLGMPNTLLLKDTSHRTVFAVWSKQLEMTEELGRYLHGAGDILLVPDASTFHVVPWSPHSAWIFCDPVLKNGETIPFSSRMVLRKAVKKLADKDMMLRVGLEVEFHVFRLLDNGNNHHCATMPGQPVSTENLAQGYQFLTEARYDELEFVMDDLRRSSDQLGLPVRSTEVEMGPSQFEFTFEPDDPLTHANNMMLFKTMVKEQCKKKGLHATFMCKPGLPNAAASGWHLHQSLIEKSSGQNLMVPVDDNELGRYGGNWIAGLLAHAKESCLLTTPSVNGYKRYQPHQLAPNAIVWGRDNRGAMLRGLMEPDNSSSRIENRIAEPLANPYYFFASQIFSGLNGINQNLQAPDAVETPYNNSGTTLIPQTLLEAIQHFRQSNLYRESLGDIFVDYLCQIKQAEWDRYHMQVSEWEQCEYFNNF